MSLWLNSLKKIFGRTPTRQPLRKSPKRTDWSSRPTLETLEERVVPSGTPFSGSGYDGTWSGSALVVNTALADGALPNQTLSIGTIQDSGNTFVTINGTEITAVLASEVHSLTLSNTDQVGVKFDLSAVSSTDFSSSGFAATVNGLASEGDTLAANNTARTWAINALDAGSAVGTDYTVTFTAISNIVGGSGNDAFEFAAGADVDGSIDGGSGANSFDFSNGGDGGYTTTVSATVSGTNSGSITANDTFNFANIQGLTGGSGANTYTFDDTSATPGLTSINGGSGSANTLDFGSINNGAITADITTANAGTVSGGATVTGFSHIQTINGSAAGGDLYKIEVPAYTGSIALEGGTAGANTLSYPNSSPGNGPLFVNLQTKTATGVSAFANIHNATVAANSYAYSLTGANSGNTWDVTSDHAGNINGGAFTFTGFNTLDAGTGGDTFNLHSGFTFNGIFNGSSGPDTVNLLGAGQTVSLTSDTSTGFSGSLTSMLYGFTSIDSLTGTGTSNVLSGENSASTWNLEGAASQYVTNSHTLVFDSSFHTLNGGTGGDTFALVTNFTGTLNGGSGANTFAFDDTSVLTGSIVGNTGTDTLDYSSYDTAIAVTLTADTAAGFTGTEPGSITGTFSKIDAIVGTGGSSDALTGENATATWTLGASPTTYAHGSDALTFSNIANLNGGTGVDTFNVSASFQGNLNGGTGNDAFVFTAAGSVTGTVNGGSTTPGDTLDYSGYGSGVDFLVTSASATTGATGTATGIGGGFAGITNLLGVTSAAVTDTLTVDYSATNYTSATWTVSGGATGTNTFTDNASNTFKFAKIENLTGSGGDTFNVTTASHTGNLASSTGTNAFNITSNSTTTVALTGNIYGGTGVDTVTITGNSSSHPASVTGNIATGGGADHLHLTGYASVGGKVDAGDPTSPDGTLSYSGFAASAVTVNIATGAATAIDGGLAGGIAHFTGFVGANTSADKLTGPNSANTWDITGTNSGDINGNSIAFSQFKNLVGGTSTDYFYFDIGGNVVSINGGAGANTADFSNYVAGITAAITGANAGNINTNAVTFSAIGSLVGSGNAANTWQFKANGSLSGSIGSGSSSGDTLTYNSTSGYTLPVTVNLATSTATLLGGTFSNITNLTGSSSTANTLIGTTADTFTLTGSNAGSDNNLVFTRFQNLIGTGAGNTFAFGPSGSLTGKVNGGSGVNETLDLSAETPAEVVNLATATATFTGGFLNISTVAGNDVFGTTLTGPNVASTWALASSDAGVINSTTTFSGFPKLVGGSMADTFDFANGATVGLSINGGAGNNTMDFSNAGSGGYSTYLAFNITANNGGSVAGPVANFSNIQNITGGSGGSDVEFLAGRGLSGALNGGLGRNILDYTNYTTPVTVNLGTGAATNVTGGISNFKDVFGSLTAKNTLTGDGGTDVLVGGAAVDAISASASGTTTGHALLIGGGGKDTITADNGWDILIGGSTSLAQAVLDNVATNFLASVTSAATLATQKAAIETTYSLSASVTSSAGSTINNGANGNDWDILNVITTLKKLKSGDIRTFE